MEHLAKKLINWASILEPGAREQALRTSSMPFIWPHLALMPDAHQGKGSTVGSVVPTLGAILPACVGVDIGCGMIAARTPLVHEDLRGKALARLREAIEQAIPLSAGHYNEAIRDSGTAKRIAELEERDGADSAEAIAPYVRGSVALTPNSRFAIKRVKAMAAIRPMATPRRIIANPCCKIRRRMSRVSAPSACRMPISLVRAILRCERFLSGKTG